MKKILKVAIIGGGYTGMIAALRLAQAGYKVEILERGVSMGGLASDFKVEGTFLERAYHHLFRTDTHIISMVKELGIEKKLKWHSSSISIYYAGTIYPFVTPIDLIRFKPLNLHNRIRAGLVVLFLQKTKKWERFQAVSAYEWMRKWAGKQVTKVIWEPLLKGKFDTNYSKVSMAWLWARIHTRANSKNKGETGEKLGYFDGGFQVFTDALLKKLIKEKVKIKKGVVIKNIKSMPSGSVEINFENGKSTNYDKCIATTPSYVFAKLIAENKGVPEAYIEKLESVNYLGARLLIFSSSQDLSKYYWHNINDTSKPFLVFINHTKLVGKKAYGGNNIYYIGSYLPHNHKLFTCDDSQLENIWFKSLKDIFPGFKPELIREKHFFRFANAQHIVEKNYAQKIPSYITPLPNIFLSNFSQIYPEDRGTNFAVREGIKIADLLQKD